MCRRRQQSDKDYARTPLSSAQLRLIGSILFCHLRRSTPSATDSNTTVMECSPSVRRWIG